jgi:hypothetical protein
MPESDERRMTAAEWAERVKGSSRSQVSDMIRDMAAVRTAKIPPGLTPWLRKPEPEEGDDVPA